MYITQNEIRNSNIWHRFFELHASLCFPAPLPLSCFPEPEVFLWLKHLLFCLTCSWSRLHSIHKKTRVLSFRDLPRKGVAENMGDALSCISRDEDEVAGSAGPVLAGTHAEAVRFHDEVVVWDADEEDALRALIGRTSRFADFDDREVDLDKGGPALGIRIILIICSIRMIILISNSEPIRKIIRVVYLGLVEKTRGKLKSNPYLLGAFLLSPARDRSILF